MISTGRELRASVYETHLKNSSQAQPVPPNAGDDPPRVGIVGARYGRHMTTCKRCGFDPGQWNEQDAVRTLLHVDLFLDLWLADTASALMGRLDARRADVVAAVEAAPNPIEGAHHLWHGLVSIADQRRIVDDAPTPSTGVVAGLHRSDGGVPKQAIDEATIGMRGVAGDRQEERLHHGRPWQALCLWSADVIESLAADGHPITFGSAGENITIRGLNWESLRAGTIVDIGLVRCQLAAPAVPCKKNAQWFFDGDFKRIHYDNAPGLTRWYASVLEPGAVAIGDVVTLSP